MHTSTRWCRDAVHRGGGAAEAAGVADQVDLHLGTMSKAFGAQGGFVACRRDLKALLLNQGRPYIFSTALPLPTVAAASAALHVSEQVRLDLEWRMLQGNFDRHGYLCSRLSHSRPEPCIDQSVGTMLLLIGTLAARAYLAASEQTRVTSGRRSSQSHNPLDSGARGDNSICSGSASSARSSCASN